MRPPRRHSLSNAHDRFAPAWLRRGDAAVRAAAVRGGDMTHGGEFEAMRDMVLDKALAHVPFEGSPEMALEAFPGGVADSLDYAASRADRAMLAALDSVDLAAMRVRDRIATAIRARLELSRPHREAIQR